jgi:tRNA G18 (ribose-2'-O)-methylase SpoU
MRKLEVEEMNRLTLDEFQQAEKFPFVIILDNIRSLNNIGSFFRTADAFKAQKIILGGYTQEPPHREITRSALGAELSVKWEKSKDVVETVRQLKSQGYQIWCVEQAEGSVLLQDFCPGSDKPCAFVFGNEVEGVANEVIAESDGCVEIPQFGTKHSFNVSVAAGIVLWEFVRQNLT